MLAGCAVDLGEPSSQTSCICRDLRKSVKVVDEALWSILMAVKMKFGPLAIGEAEVEAREAPSLEDMAETFPFSYITNNVTIASRY
jgi:hypothetical protein